MREGWEIRKLGEITSFVGDGDWIESKDQSPEGIRLIQTGNIGEGIYKDKGERAKYISTDTFQRLHCTEIFAGDCLVSRLPDPIGRACFLPKLNERTITAVDCSIIRFNPTFLPQIFVYYSRSNQYQSYINTNATGTTRKRISRKRLEQAPVPVPPIHEQEKIVAELDCLTGIIEKKKQQLQELDKLAQSIFYDIFGSGEYQKGQLISLCADKDDIKCGPFGTQLSKSEFHKEGVPVWGIPQVNSNFAIPPVDFVSEEKALALQSFSIIGGDIVMSRKGNIGQSAIYPNSFESGILHSDVLRIRVKRELANPLYLVYQFHQSAEIKHQFKVIGYGAIMPGLNVSKLKSVIVDIPPIILQNEFAQKIDTIEKQKELVKRSIVETETLFRSRMDYWFN